MNIHVQLQEHNYTIRIILCALAVNIYEAAVGTPVVYWVGLVKKYNLNSIRNNIVSVTFS